MGHVAFHYAVGFAVAGFFMLIFAVMTLAARVLDPLNTATLALTVILPFVVSMLSWRESRRLHKPTVASEGD